MSNADHLSQSGYRQLRGKVATVLAGGTDRGIIHIPEPEHKLTAERLIDAGYIDVDKVLGLPGA